jgi:hypothetical protein
VAFVDARKGRCDFPHSCANPVSQTVAIAPKLITPPSNSMPTTSASSASRPCVLMRPAFGKFTGSFTQQHLTERGEARRGKDIMEKFNTAVQPTGPRPTQVYED